MGLFSRERPVGRPLIKKATDRDDLNAPHLPECHPRNGGHDVNEIDRWQHGSGKTVVKGKCSKCGVITTETL